MMNCYSMTRWEFGHEVENSEVENPELSMAWWQSTTRTPMTTSMLAWHSMTRTSMTTSMIAWHCTMRTPLTTSTDIHMSVVRILSVSLCLVSIAVLWFALPAVGYALVLPAVGYVLLLGSFHYCSRSSMFLSCGPRTLVALLILLATSSLAVVSESLCGSLRLRGSFLASTCTTIWLHPTWWFVVGPLEPLESSSQQRVMLSVRSGLRGSLYLLLVGVLQDHCVVLWAVSTLITKAVMAASCHGVVFWFVQHCRVVIDPRVSLIKILCHFRALLPFTCADDSCVSLSCTRAAVPTLLNVASSSLSWMRPLLSADIRLFWSGFVSAGVPRLRHVWWSLLALFHSRTSKHVYEYSLSPKKKCGRLSTISVISA